MQLWSGTHRAHSEVHGRFEGTKSRWLRLAACVGMLLFGTLAQAFAVPTPPANPDAVTSAHPRMILDAETLTDLRNRASHGTPQWRRLKKSCDSYTGGTVNFPSEENYPNLPNLGQGYQGDAYLPALMNSALCYQILKTEDPKAAARYGAKGVELLMKMSTPFSKAKDNQGEDPMKDDGYVIRFYGVGFGLGYDWLYDLLTPAQRSQVYATANAWLAAWENPRSVSQFEYVHPQSNYFAGYFHAKAAIALGTYGENPDAPAEWRDWLGHQFAGRVRPYYAKHLQGGGWPEGFANYAPLAMLNMSLPIREVQTATGQDLLDGITPYIYPVDNADYVMQFTWPSRAYFDDRDTSHSNTLDTPPGSVPVNMFEQILGDLVYWHSPKAAVFHGYLDEVKKATSEVDGADPWLSFLDVDPSSSKADVKTLPLSYFATGMNAVAARSDWSTGASWMSFRAGPYVNNPAQGEELFDQGSLALVHGALPLLVNAGGWVVHNPNGSADENNVYNDNFGEVDRTVYVGNRQMYNVFYVRHMRGDKVAERYGQAAYTSEDDNARTRIAAFEDGGDYVYMLATNIENMYRKFTFGPGVAAWSRQIIYLRPNRFVVYDRTAEGRADYDQFLAWHFPANPQQAQSAGGQNRLDITYQHTYVGAMTTVLPQNTKVTTLPLYPHSDPVKVWQVQERPPTNDVAQKWLTVFDLSPSADAVAAASPVTIMQGHVVGVRLAASDGNNVVITSTEDAGSAIEGAIAYSVPVAAAHHLVTGLAANAGYRIAVSNAGATQTISVSPDGASKASASGVLDFDVDASGKVQQIQARALPDVDQHLAGGRLAAKVPARKKHRSN